MSTLPHLFRHHRWATVSLIDHLTQAPAETLELGSPGAYGTVHQTLTHMLEGEARYLLTLQGERDVVTSPLPDPLPGLRELRAAAAAQGDALIDIAGELADDATLTGTFNRRPFEMPAFVLLFQAYNHGVEHRTNITTTLVSHGYSSPLVDLWAYLGAGLP